MSLTLESVVWLGLGKKTTSLRNIYTTSTTTIFKVTLCRYQELNIFSVNMLSCLIIGK